MKKIYLLAIGLATISLNAQSLNNANQVSTYSGSIETQQKAPADMFVQESNGQNGYSVGYLQAFGGGIYLADDFEILETAKINKIKTVGFTTKQPFTTLLNATTAVTMHIFKDANGAPATIPANAYKTITLPKGATGLTLTANGQLYEMSIDLAAAGIDLTLEGKTRYWFSVAPTTNLQEDIRYAWFKATDNKFAGQVQLIDPDDLFEDNLTTWTPIDDILTNPWGDFGLAFTITGDTALGTSELYSSVKPVMATQQGDLLHIFTKNDKLKSADIYANDGKKVASGTADKLNIGQLPKGVYILNVTLSSGKTESTKFIKR